jgi:cytidylate kinase
MADKQVITIARQFGSGGSYIAQQVAKRLHYAYIDRQILEQAAKELEIEKCELEDREERVQGFWENMIPGFALGAPYVLYPIPLRWVTDEQVFKTQGRLITELAVKGSCVVLGRGAFHLLRGKVPLINIFIHAPLAFRVERVMNIYAIPNKAEALQIIHRSDRNRRKYIRAFTGCDWLDTRNYHLAIDTGKISFEAAEEMIACLAGRPHISGTCCPG